MTEPTYFILVSLLDEPRHGYGIIKETDLLSRGRVRMTAGTLYTALDRLTNAGLTAVVRRETVAGRARTYYGLTSTGRDAVTQEAKRMRENADLASPRRRPRVATT